MNDEDKLATLRKIEKEIAEIFSTSNRSLQFAKGSNEYLAYIAGALAYFFPGATPIGMCLANGLHTFLRNSMIPAISRWRVDSVVAGLRKRVNDKFEAWWEELYLVDLSDEDRI